jgi:hypothetical protein
MTLSSSSNDVDRCTARSQLRPQRLESRCIRTSVWRAGCVACAGVALLSAWLAVQDLGRLAQLAYAQFASGAAQGSDFLNLYAGAALLLRQPTALYDLNAQLAVQRDAGWSGSIVPFLLPPYAAVPVAWLGIFAYPTAYVVWFIINVACIVLAAYCLAPRPSLAWAPLGLLFLPALLGLVQGQTAALMLLGFGGAARLLLRESHAPWRLAVSVLPWLLKPQLGILFVLALLLARRGAAVLALGAFVGGFTLIALVRIGAAGLAAYANVGRQKLTEAVSSEPAYLPGPTLVHASQWLLGPGTAALLLASILLGLALLACAAIWRHGLAKDDIALFQLAALPIAATLCAPYALVHELTAWLGSFWLLWRATADRPWGRAGLVWLAAAIWLAGNLGVALPTAGGSDIAALLGVLAGHALRR